MIKRPMHGREIVMAPAVRRKKRKDEIKVTIAPFRNLADYKSCEEIQREVWRFQDIDIVPIPLLLAINRTGGIILGAYNTLGEMIGFVLSILGSANDEPLHHSIMLAVRVAYRNFDVGFKLKLAQRKEALKRNISLITSSFDPMQPLNAYFTLGKLGARANAYEENSCGDSASLLDRGPITDRIVAHWDLESDLVVHRLEAGPLPRDIRKELKQLPVINHMTEVAPGMVNSSPVKLNCTAGQFLFEVPHNLPEIRNRDLGVALEWQGKMRQVFRHYFKKDYAAADFWVAEQDGRLRAFYVLEKNKS
jgi:predicted GNAT superfamily acetyltransferase